MVRSAGLVAAALLLPGCAVSAGCGGPGVVRVHRGPRATGVVRLEVAPGAARTLSVETSAGDAAAAAAPGAGPVLVTATVEAATEEDLARIHPFARVEGAEVRVGYTVDGDEDGTGVSFEVTAPAGLALRLESSAGDLSARGFAAGVEARTSAGEVEVRDCTGDLALVSSAGDVTAEGADGRVRAESSAGSVRVAGRLRGECLARTSAGNATAALPPDARLRIRGRTSAGSARSDFPLRITGKAAEAALEGTLGDGSEGALLLESSAGDVAVERR